MIDKYGAEILRLWVSASDYREDIRISDEILAQLSDAYRRIRNTFRFLLGNLYDFEPASDAVPPGDMPEIDRYTLHKLQLLVEKARRAYDLYEYHTIYHALHNFCAIDLSALYLDILKDRLYTSPAASRERRSAQTVLHHLLDTLARLMAPILPFTAEEIWRHMPDAPGKPASIHLALLPVADAALVDAGLAERWELLLKVRGEVTKALEEARVKKEIGHALDAAVTLAADPELHARLAPYAAELRVLFIVSAAELVDGTAAPEGAVVSAEVPGLSTRVSTATGRKCERCWVHEPSVGESAEHPAICSRCRTALK